MSKDKSKRYKVFLYGLKKIYNIHKTSFLIIFFDMFIAFIPFLYAVIFAELVDSISVSINLKKNIYYILIIMIIQLLQGLYKEMRQYMVFSMKKNITLNIKADILSVLETVKADKFEDNKFLMDIKRKQNISSALSDMLKSIGILLGLFVTLCSYLIYLYKINPTIAMVGVIPLFPSIMQSIYNSKIHFRLVRKVNILEQRKQRLENIFFNHQSGKEIRIFNAFSFLIVRWEKIWQKLFNERLKMRIKEFSISFVLNLISSLSFIFLLFLIIKQVYVGSITLGIAIGLIPFTLKVSGGFKNIQSTLKGVIYSFYEWEELFIFLNRKNTKTNMPTTNNNSKKELNKILINNVSYTYPNGKIALSNINFEINIGETVAIIGENGSGKTTLLNILSGAYEPTEGCLINYSNKGTYISKKKYRDLISFVSQNPIKYPLSIDENISFKQGYKEKIQATAQKVGIPITEIRERANIMALGYTQGTNISGGEWQRIAIARSLIKNDALVYIFDEPTASLDPKAELEVFNLFFNMTKSKTTILSSHRLGLARKADKIIVLDNGKIESIGTHDELIKYEGIYSKLFNAQSEWYKQKGRGA